MMMMMIIIITITIILLLLLLAFNQYSLDFSQGRALVKQKYKSHYAKRFLSLKVARWKRVCGKAMRFSTQHCEGKSLGKLSAVVQQRFTLVRTVNNLYGCTLSYLEYQFGGVCQ